MAIPMVRCHVTKYAVTILYLLIGVEVLHDANLCVNFVVVVVVVVM